MIKRLGLAMFVLFVLLVLDIRSNSQYAAEPSAPVPEHVSDEVIVRFREGVDESRKDLARFRVSGNRKKVFQTLRGLEVDQAASQHIGPRSNRSFTNKIQMYCMPNRTTFSDSHAKAELTATPNDPSFGSLYGLTKINAPGAWNITTGSSNAVVAMIDTGFDYNHPDLAANMFNNSGRVQQRRDR